MFKRKRSPHDFAEEIKAHLELEGDELKAEGLSEEEAHRRARVEFGNVHAAQERFYLKGRWAWLDKLLRDVRYGFRSLLQSPGFAITTILTLALGMGANTAVFSVMNAVLLQSLPVADAGRVVVTLRREGAGCGELSIRCDWSGGCCARGKRRPCRARGKCGTVDRASRRMNETAFQMRLLRTLRKKSSPSARAFSMIFGLLPCSISVS